MRNTSSQIAVEGLRKLEPQAAAAGLRGAHEGAVGCDLGRIHERAELGLDLPWFSDCGRVRRVRNRREGCLRIVARQEPPVEDQADLVLHGVGRLRP
jgi:hypothetical protein